MCATYYKSSKGLISLEISEDKHCVEISFQDKHNAEDYEKRKNYKNKSMETRDYIQDLEERYKQYCNKKSGVLFNRTTDIFMEELYSMPIAKTAIEELLREYPVTNERFTTDQEQDINYLTDIFLEMNQDEYIAYCIQYLRYLHNSGTKDHYYDETVWIDKDYETDGDRLELFKSDYIGFIVDYIINAYKANEYIIVKILKYKEWVERFKVIESKGNWKEKELQKHLAEFLFLHGVEFFKEVNTSNGSLDFLLPQNDIGEEMANTEAVGKQGKNSIYIEVKKFRNEKQIQDACIQLKAIWSRWAVKVVCWFMQILT